MLGDWPEFRLVDALADRPHNGFSPIEVEPWTGVVALGLGCLTPDGFQPRQVKNVPANDPRYAGSWLSDGDLLMSRSNTFELVGLVGRYQDVGVPCVYPDLMMRLTPKPSVRPAFLEAVLRSESVRSQINAIAQGTSGSMVKISASSVSNLRVRIPALVEQDRILEIVDALDRRMYTEKKVIAKEQSISFAFTDSLMQDSQAYLGSTLGSVVRSAIDGPFGSNLKSEHYVDEPGVRVVRLQNVGAGKFLDGDRAYISSRHAASLSRHDVRGGDLVVASLGDERHPMGRACLYPTDLDAGIVKADCFRIRTDSDIALNSFVMRALNSRMVRKEIMGAAHGITRDRVNLANLLSVMIPLPPIVFQRRVVQILDDQDETIRVAERELAKLHTLKQGLMDDLLTGRVRVGSAPTAASLP